MMMVSIIPSAVNNLKDGHGVPPMTNHHSQIANNQFFEAEKLVIGDL
jgi:hypothetical protein